MSDIQVRVEGHAFVIGSDDIARVTDEEAARWLGFGTTKAAQNLIRKSITDGFLVAPEFSTATVLNPKGRPSKVYSLTRAGVIKVAMRSDLPKAHALVDDVIRVYEEVQRLRTAPAALTAPAGKGAFSGVLGDNPHATREFRNLIYFGAIVTGVTQQRVRGYITRCSGAASYLRMFEEKAEGYRRLLDDVCKGKIPAPWKVPKFLPDPRQPPLPGMQ